MEIWKPIKGYEGLYEVSNLGSVKSLYSSPPLILKQCIGSKGYCLVTLCKQGKQTSYNVHKLVAKAFIPNPYSYPCINHKDENKTNNNIGNLEWCSYYHNNTYGTRLTKSALKRGKPVRCIDTGVIYASASAAQRETGIDQSYISACCLGKRKPTKRYNWEFINKA